MELKNFIEKFAEQFIDTPAEEINADTIYKNLDEWSSITTLSVIAMIDENFDTLLTRDDINSVDTVEELYLKIKERL